MDESHVALPQLRGMYHGDQARKPYVANFVQAMEAGIQYLVNHPEESWQLFIKGRRELDNELNRRAWKDTLPRFALRPAPT